MGPSSTSREGDHLKKGRTSAGVKASGSNAHGGDSKVKKRG